MKLASTPWAKIRFSWADHAPIYEKEAWKHITCPKRGIAIDVGAHQGFYTTKLAREVGDGGRVYAFEPEPENYSVLCSNLELNHLNNVVPLQVALSDYDGEGSLFTYRNEIGWDSGKHFLRGSSKGQPYWDKPDMPVSLSEYETIVEVKTLDTVLSSDPPHSLDLIKIDVEGSEHKVLKGASETLKHYSPKIVLEVHYNQIYKILKHPSILIELGYRLVEYEDKLEISSNPLAVFERRM